MKQLNQLINVTPEGLRQFVGVRGQLEEQGDQNVGVLTVDGHLDIQVVISGLKTIDMDIIKYKWLRIQYSSEHITWIDHREKIVFLA